MKRLVKVVLVLVALLLVVAVVVGLVKDRVAGRMLVKMVEEKTGFGASFDSLSVGLWSARVDLRGFELQNPPPFKETTAVRINRALADCERSTLFSDEIHVLEAELDLGLVVVEFDESGKSNLQALIAAVRPPAGAPSPTPPAPPPPGEDEAAPAATKSVRMDKLTIRLGSVRVLTPMRDGTVNETSVDLDKEFVFRHVTNLEPVIAEVGMYILVNAGIPLGEGMKDYLREQNPELEKLYRDHEDEIRELQDDVKGKMEDIRGKLKGLF